MAIFFLLRHNDKHMSALLATIDLARGDGPCTSIAAERPHITCFCSVVPKPFISSGKEDTRSHSYFTNKKKHCQPPADTLLRQTKTTPSSAQPLSRKEADQTGHDGIITFRCLRRHDVITTPYSTFSWSCLGINCTAVIGSSSSTTSSVSGKCGRWHCL